MAIMAAPEHDDEYTVAWIDCLASGKSLGRSVFMRGHHADGPLGHGPAPAKLALPVNLPALALNRWSVKAFNAFYYRWEGRKRKPVRCDIAPFFYPLDGIRDWNRLYGKPGFVQYQFVLPTASAAEGLRTVLDRLARSGNASFLAVLKRFGAQGSGLLSFPTEGWTLALDLPLRQDTLGLLDTLDAVVLEHGGDTDGRTAPSQQAGQGDRGNRQDQQQLQRAGGRDRGRYRRRLQANDQHGAECCDRGRDRPGCPFFLGAADPQQCQGCQDQDAGVGHGLGTEGAAPSAFLDGVSGRPGLEVMIEQQQPHGRRVNRVFHDIEHPLYAGGNAEPHRHVKDLFG